MGQDVVDRPVIRGSPPAQLLWCQALRDLRDPPRRIREQGEHLVVGKFAVGHPLRPFPNVPSAHPQSAMTLLPQPFSIQPATKTTTAAPGSGAAVVLERGRWGMGSGRY